ncbi:hypothetical protein STEG23_019736, partial [Scotinomys teguina]
MPPGMRFAQAALAARAPVAQDETWGHAARPGSQPDAAVPAASALVPGRHARSLQVGDPSRELGLLVEESREDTHGTPAAMKTLKSPVTSVPLTRN